LNDKFARVAQAWAAECNFTTVDKMPRTLRPEGGIVGILEPSFHDGLGLHRVATALFDLR
jgi:hypothetical protein